MRNDSGAVSEGLRKEARGETSNRKKVFSRRVWCFFPETEAILEGRERTEANILKEDSVFRKSDKVSRLRRPKTPSQVAQPVAAFEQNQVLPQHTVTFTKNSKGGTP